MVIARTPRTRGARVAVEARRALLAREPAVSGRTAALLGPRGAGTPRLLCCPNIVVVGNIIFYLLSPLLIA